MTATGATSATNINAAVRRVHHHAPRVRRVPPDPKESRDRKEFRVPQEVRVPREVWDPSVHVESTDHRDLKAELDRSVHAVSTDPKDLKAELDLWDPEV